MLSPAAECTPPLDILEIDEGLEIIVDLPAVRADDIEVAFSGNVLLIGGRKQPARCEHREAGFHLAERTFGRFARMIQLEGAYDTARAKASLSHGELRVFLPRVEERRGGRIAIPVTE
jgi:HSP20 family protein